MEVLKRAKDFRLFLSHGAGEDDGKNGLEDKQKDSVEDAGKDAEKDPPDESYLQRFDVAEKTTENGATITVLCEIIGRACRDIKGTAGARR